MQQWTDLFLNMPLPESWMRGLLFITFGLHLLFVLLMLGTAILSLLFFLRDLLRQPSPPQHWNEHVAHSHMGLKSLAVVLGVGPLLIMQVSHSHAFFTVTVLFSYAWLAIIPLLITAFLLFDAFAHKLSANAWLALICGLVGVGALLTVPAIFTGALTLMERPASWADFAARGIRMDTDWMPHWVLRYLHIVGAALAFGAAFHLFYSARNDAPKARLLRKWLIGSLAVQAVVGFALLATILPQLSSPVLTAISLGALALGTALWILRPESAAADYRLLALLPIIFVTMLLARQLLQLEAMGPTQAEATAQRQQKVEELAPFSQKALDAFAVKLRTVYDNGDTIYDGACEPCHGLDGRGVGPESHRLRTPATDLAALRIDRDYAYEMICDGTPGTGMPYFRMFDREKIDALLDALDRRFAMFAATPPPPRDISPESLEVWIGMCAKCHAADGSVTATGKAMQPPPPDFRRSSVSHERALKIITEGYPGTGMPAYRNQPAKVREDLAIISNSFRAAHKKTETRTGR
ncbi:cytochrome c [Desulfovibrio sp.]|uniref:c-type cytochrome n=1 Tax=Desulfovibrio sp. TaxID=885 RepID=UPI0035B145C8